MRYLTVYMQSVWHKHAPFSTSWKNTFLMELTKILSTFPKTLSIFPPLNWLNWRRKWQPTPVFLPRESHGQRSLVGCCPQGRTELDTTEVTQHACVHWRRKWQPTPVFLPGESQGQRSLVGCRLWGRTESDTTEVTQQQQQQQIGSTPPSSSIQLSYDSVFLTQKVKNPQ